MKSENALYSQWFRWTIIFLMLGAAVTWQAVASTFSFTLDEPSKTSAGVFLTDGTLIRTLWSKVTYPAGTNTSVWDELDDNGNAVTQGVYQIKILQHNTEYVWDGVVGNTSAEVSGPTVHMGFYPLRDMAIAGTNGFYVSGYNENLYDFRSFYTSDPQRVQASWGPGWNKPANIYDRNWLYAATDGNLVYFACSAASDPNNGQDNAAPGFITAFNVKDKSHAYFSKGVPIPNGVGPNEVYPNGVYVGTKPGLTGMAVQSTGNLLAASVAPDNQVYLLDKVSGAAIANFAVSSPGRMNFSPDGSLWLISGNNVVCYTNISANPSVAVTITNLIKPLDVAVHPTNSNLILVADGGSSQQVKAFSSAGDLLWSYGLAGGYPANGVAVATNKFWFFDGENEGTFLCFASDGTFWVGDGGNHRSLHFSIECNYLEQIMFQIHSYVACVDQNDPSRVFNQFLEFKVDYSKPLQQGWILVNNWKVNVDAAHISWNEGIIEVTTLTNGRTYALIDNNNYQFAPKELCELTTNQLRMTGIMPMITNANRCWVSLGPDGSACGTTIGFARWYQSTLASFDASNNPVWNPETMIASAPEGSRDPVPRGSSFGNLRAPITANNVLVAYDQSLNDGWHLGGIKVGTTNWLWKASPAATWMSGLGNYEIANGVVYAGNTLQAVDRNIVFGYHGEFFRNQGQASQHMHYYDDGLFVGQFGEASPGHSAYEGAWPGFAGNAHCPSLIKIASGDYYLWVNDEGSHGPQRWHLVNARNIREQTGSGALGSVITLTNELNVFPVGLKAISGDALGELSWQGVAGADSYNVRYSLINGGPYNLVAGNTTNLNYVARGLTNGVTYYFAVAAVRGGIEGIPSEQVKVCPFDTTQNVFCTGSMAEGGQYTPVIEVNSSAPAAGQPSYVGAEHYCSVPNLRELDGYGYGNLENEIVGTKGYVIYDWGGNGANLMNVLAPVTISTSSGWGHLSYLKRQYRVDNQLGTDQGLFANPVGLINVGVTDTNFHYLTVVSPAQFNDTRNFTMSLTSTNGGAVKYAVNESPGYSHVFQFRFKGNVTLTADAAGGKGGIVQSIFVDDAPASFSIESSTNLEPPSLLHILKIGK